jgi:hypothetical protein
MKTLWEVSMDLSHRLIGTFLKDAAGKRPVFGGEEKFQNDPQWNAYPLFYEYFHGDNGAGIGASHQTGWTGLVAWLLKSRAILKPEEVLEKGYDAVALKLVRCY